MILSFSFGALSFLEMMSHAVVPAGYALRGGGIMTWDQKEFLEYFWLSFSIAMLAVGVFCLKKMKKIKNAAN